MEAIQEIMRVLQLTSYDEDEWESDELTINKRIKVNNMYLRKGVVSEPVTGW